MRRIRQEALRWLCFKWVTKEVLPLNALQSNISHCDLNLQILTCVAPSTFCCLIFNFFPSSALETLTTFSNSPHLSLQSPPLWNMTAQNLHHITPLFSSPVSQMKAFLCRQTSESFLRAELRPVSPLLVALFAAFSDLFIHFWLWHLHACQEFQSEPHMCIMRAESNSHLKYTWIAWIYLLWRSPCTSRGVLFPALEWSGFLKCPTQHHQIEWPVYLSHNGRKMSWLLLEGLGQSLQSSVHSWGFNWPSICIRRASCDEPLKDVSSSGWKIALALHGYWDSSQQGRKKKSW